MIRKDIIVIKLKKQPKIYFVKRLFPPFRAMTIPPFGIFIKKDFQNKPAELEQIPTHDKIHWKQYERMGLFMYYFRYFTQLLLIGYDTMPMEMEARQYDESQWNYRETYHKNTDKKKIYKYGNN